MCAASGRNIQQPAADSKIRSTASLPPHPSKLLLAKGSILFHEISKLAVQRGARSNKGARREEEAVQLFPPLSAQQRVPLHLARELLLKPALLCVLLGRILLALPAGDSAALEIPARPARSVDRRHRVVPIPAEIAAVLPAERMLAVDRRAR